MVDRNDHRWVRTRLVAWRAGLLSDEDVARVASHLESCLECRAYDDAFQLAPDREGAGAHVPAAVLADWPRARRTLRGLERGLVRKHLERCAECRQDLEMLGHEPILEVVPELEPAVDPIAILASSRARDPEAEAPEPARSAPPAQVVIRLARPARARFVEWWNRALVGWATVATAAAIIAIVVHARRPIVEGAPPWAVMASPSDPARPTGPAGLSLRIAPPARKLSGPAHRETGGKVNVIPVVGPVSSLALAVRPLNVPDTSLVTVLLRDADGNTLFTVRHRQWEFFPKRVLVIEGTDEPLQPGRYALELASLITGDASPIQRMSRYRFELRPR